MKIQIPINITIHCSVCGEKLSAVTYEPPDYDLGLCVEPCEVCVKKYRVDSESGIEQDDVENYIYNLAWTEDTPDIHKTLVAGNIRSFYTWIKEKRNEQRI